MPSLISLRRVTRMRVNRRQLILRTLEMGMAAVLLAYVFPSIGSLLGIFLCASPLQAVKLAEKVGELGTLNPIPTCVFLGNSLVWLLYGAAIENKFIWMANMPCIPINLYLILRCYALASKQMRASMDWTLMAVCALVLSVGTLFIFMPDRKTATSISGDVAMVVNILLYASPLSSMGMVLKLRNSSSILLPFALMGLGCSATWCFYGLAIKQIPVVVPNLCGVVCSVLQLLLRALFPALHEAPPLEADIELGKAQHKPSRHLTTPLSTPCTSTLDLTKLDRHQQGYGEYDMDAPATAPINRAASSTLSNRRREEASSSPIFAQDKWT